MGPIPLTLQPDPEWKQRLQADTIPEETSPVSQENGGGVGGDGAKSEADDAAGDAGK